MKIIPVLEQQISQAEFSQMIGVSEARASQLVSEGVIASGDDFVSAIHCGGTVQGYNQLPCACIHPACWCGEIIGV